MILREHFLPEGAALYCPNGLVGKGSIRGTLFLLDLLWGSGTHEEGFYGGLTPRSVATIWLFVTF